MTVSKREAEIVIIATIIVVAVVIWAVFFHVGGPVVQRNNDVEQENDEPYQMVPVPGIQIPSGMMEIHPQALGNLPWGAMSGALTVQEIEGVSGVRFPVSNLQTRGGRIDALNMSPTARFERVLFVIKQSWDDRKVYWAEDVDIQRWNTFAVNSKDQYIFEKFGDFYVSRDGRGNVSFVGYGLISVDNQKKVQSFVNVPWQNLSGNLPLEEVAKRLTFPQLGSVNPYAYNPEEDIDRKIRSFNLSEGEKRGWQVTDRAVMKQIIFLYNGKIYEATNVEISPGDYPGGITPTGDTPPFLLMTVRAGQPEQKVYIILFYDKDKNLVAAGWTDELPSTSSFGGGAGGGTSSYSSSSSSSGGSSPSSSASSTSSSSSGGSRGRPPI